MRISPISRQMAQINSNSQAQSAGKFGCRKPAQYRHAPQQKDLFIKLAEASLRDVKIESELKSMGLI